MNEIDRITRALQNAATDAPEQAHQVFEAVATQAEQEIRAAAPRKTGATAASIHVEFSDPLTMKIHGSAIAGYNEFGTKPHEIRPKHGEFLTFKIDGRWVRARKVNHPGTPPRPFIRPVIDEIGDELGDKLGAMGAALIARQS